MIAQRQASKTKWHWDEILRCDWQSPRVPVANRHAA
jgi:hypothetical protein